MRYAVVTETWPPEINGVAMTLGRLYMRFGLADHLTTGVRRLLSGLVEVAQTSCDEQLGFNWVECVN